MFVQLTENRNRNHWGTVSPAEEVKKETEYRTTNVLYDLSCGKGRNVQFECREKRKQVHADRILERALQLRDSIKRVRNQSFESVLMDLHDYLNAALAALRAPPATQSGRLAGCASEAAN